MTEPKFVNGLYWKDASEKSPEWVKGKISVKVEEFIEYLKQNQDNGWVNINLLESKEKKQLYFALDTWKPEKKEETKNDNVEEVNVENIPF